MRSYRTALTALFLVLLGVTAFVGVVDARNGNAVRNRLASALQGLVQEGTLTQDQAAAVQERVEPIVQQAEREGEGRGWRADKLRPGRAAEALGMTSDELMEQMRDGKTLAQIASSKGISENELVGKLLAPLRTKLDTAVKEKRITQARADEVVSRATEQARELTNAKLEDLHPGQGRKYIGGWGRLAKVLEVHPQELRQELASGKTLAQVAAAQGMSEQQLRQKLMTIVRERVNEAVREKDLTRAQADRRLQAAEERISEAINRDFSNMPGMQKGKGWKMKPGRGWDGPGRGQPEDASGDE